MKANEIRIGNSINNGIEDIIIDYVFHEEVSDTWQVCWNDKCSTEFLEDCEPIPLTEDWLIKLGFDLDETKGFDRGESLRVFSISNFHIAIDNGVFYLWIEIDEDNWYNLKLKRIDFIHQLQNLYFALTGEELTINQ
jgi:hypothetical protein